MVIGMAALGFSTWAAAQPLQVAALHPLLADLARQVGGERVQVYDIVGEGGNLHRFEPRPADMRRLQSSALVLASGKGMEPYLGRVKAALANVDVVEVGKTIPSLMAGHDDCDDAGHPHDDTMVDPHWWHGIDNMRRAARIVAHAMAAKDPSGREAYLTNSSAYGRKLEELKRWAGTELAKVPRPQRKLVTAHNAFGYFAREFGYEVIAVSGLNQEQNATPQQLAATIATIQQTGVRAVFPETNATGKVLETITLATGARTGQPLIADGNGTGPDAGFEGMIRHNVNSITAALTTP